MFLSDEPSEAATRSGQTSSNHGLPMPSAYIATERKNGAMYPVINNVRTLQVPEQNISDQGEMPTVVRNSQPCGRTTNTNCTLKHNGQATLKNTQITPQRPQDLLDNVSLDVARINVKSSAQYRKSYAFKIWRDKGSFPYRLADQPIVKEVVERKKSKKYLNAVRAHKDRENEEAWRAFKSCRSTSNEMKYRRTSKFLRVQTDDSIAEQDEKDQLDMILLDSQDKDPKERSTKQQNGIPDYFKSKKEPAQKSQPLVSPTKSIPTSVIHVNITKACDVSKPTTQAEHSMMTSDNVGYEIIKLTTQTADRIHSNETFENKLSAATEEEQSSFSQWSTAQTSSGNYNRLSRGQEYLNINAMNSVKQLPTHTMPTAYSTLVDSNSARTTAPSTSPNLTSNSNKSPENSMNEGEYKTSNTESERLSTEIESNKKGTAFTVTDQSLSPSSTPEPCSEIDNSKLASIIKKSLTKKYSKENVEPTSAPTSAAGERGRKRVRHESSDGNDEDERQRARMKQEKSTMFARLDEAVATNLADGIHNVNSEYFPIEALANKAATETSKDASHHLESRVQTHVIKHKLDEIERAR